MILYFAIYFVSMFIMMVAHTVNATDMTWVRICDTFLPVINTLNACLMIVRAVAFFVVLAYNKIAK